MRLHGSDKGFIGLYGKYTVEPTILQALCSERFRDWSNKFTPLGIKCAHSTSSPCRVLIDVVGCELTGDTVTFGNGAWGDARQATIMYVFHILLKVVTELSIA